MDAQGWLLEEHPGSNALVVAFTSFGDAPGRPPRSFEWCDLLAGLPCGRLYLRDTSQLWFQHGALGAGTTPEELTSFIVTVAKGRPILTLGSSMGGFAALLYGALAGARSVLAVSPQTSIHPATRPVTEHRYLEVMDAAHAEGPFPDVLPLYLAGGGARGARLLYGADVSIDRRHAERLLGVPGVTVEPHENGGAALAYALLRHGKLLPLVEHELRTLALEA